MPSMYTGSELFRTDLEKIIFVDLLGLNLVFHFEAQKLIVLRSLFNIAEVSCVLSPMARSVVSSAYT